MVTLMDEFLKCSNLSSEDEAQYSQICIESWENDMVSRNFGSTWSDELSAYRPVVIFRGLAILRPVSLFLYSLVSLARWALARADILE